MRRIPHYQVAIESFSMKESPLRSDNLFSLLYSGREYTFWLDSSRLIPDIRYCLHLAYMLILQSKYSYMGEMDGPDSFLLHYFLPSKRVQRISRSSPGYKAEEFSLAKDANFFEYLHALLESKHCHSGKLFLGLN